MSSPIPRPSLMDMPVEILEAIVAEVQGKSDLLSLARTCRLLSCIAQPQLYTSMYFENAESMERTFPFIKGYPARAQKVRSFAFKPYDGLRTQFYGLDFLSHLPRLENLYIEGRWRRNTDEWDRFMLEQTASRGVLHSLKTCTLLYNITSFDIPAHHFTPIFILPNLQKLSVHGIDCTNLAKNSGPPATLQTLELWSGILFPEAIGSILRTATSLTELVLGDGQFEDRLEYSDMVEALEQASTTLRKLVISYPRQGIARRPMRLHNMVALRYLGVPIDIWLAGLCDAPLTSAEEKLRPLIPPRLETLKTGGLWTSKPQIYADDYLVDLLGPVLKNKKDLAPFLTRITLPGCFGYYCRAGGAVSSEFAEACVEAQIAIRISWNFADYLSNDTRYRQADRFKNRSELV